MAASTLYKFLFKGEMMFIKRQTYKAMRDEIATKDAQIGQLERRFENQTAQVKALRLELCGARKEASGHVRVVGHLLRGDK